MNDTPQTPFISGTRTEGLIVGGLAIVFGLLVSLFVGEDSGWITGSSAGALATVILVAWPLRKERWFWTAVAVFTALHLFALVHFDWSWTHTWTGHTLGGFMTLDIIAMLGIIYGLYRLVYGAPAEVVADVPEEPRYSDRDIL